MLWCRVYSISTLNPRLTMSNNNTENEEKFHRHRHISAVDKLAKQLTDMVYYYLLSFGKRLYNLLKLSHPYRNRISHEQQCHLDPTTSILFLSILAIPTIGNKVNSSEGLFYRRPAPGQNCSAKIKTINMVRLSETRICYPSIQPLTEYYNVFLTELQQRMLSLVHSIDN